VRALTNTERVAYVVGGLLLTSGLIHLAILVVTSATWEGPLSLRKAMTFGVSFGLTLLTIVWVSSFVRLGNRTRAILLGAFTLACVLETVLVSMQAWRGVPSHFNLETPFDAVVARTLAMGGGVLIAIIVTFTIAAFRANPSVPLSLRVAVRVGFVLLCISLAVGGAMIAKGMSLVFAGHPQAAYVTAGALKPTHAVTMHAILVLPLFAWLLSRTQWPERRRVTAVGLAAAAYVAIAAIVAIANVSIG
jgi:hypothetical protein